MRQRHWWRHRLQKANVCICIHINLPRAHSSVIITLINTFLAATRPHARPYVLSCEGDLLFNHKKFHLIRCNSLIYSFILIILLLLILYTHARTHPRTHTHTYTHTNARIHAHTYAHTDAHTHSGKGGVSLFALHNSSGRVFYSAVYTSAAGDCCDKFVWC